MDEARNPSSTADSPTRAGVPAPVWTAVAAPIIRSISFRLARRYWLQPSERQDLEQELWL